MLNTMHILTSIKFDVVKSNCTCYRIKRQRDTVAWVIVLLFQKDSETDCSWITVGKPLF